MWPFLEVAIFWQWLQVAISDMSAPSPALLFFRLRDFHKELNILPIPCLPSFPNSECLVVLPCLISFKGMQLETWWPVGWGWYNWLQGECWTSIWEISALGKKFEPSLTDCWLQGCIYGDVLKLPSELLPAEEEFVVVVEQAPLSLLFLTAIFKP